MNQAIVKITWSDGSVSYMHEKGIVVTDEDSATVYSLKTAKAIAKRSRSILGERYEVVEVR